jgi:hypothetical protein
VSCPFYGASIHFDHLVRFPGPSGNQCALITSAHSPCWMQLEEGAMPNWTSCPRNPEFVATAVFENLHTDIVSGRQADVRLLASVRDLNRLMRIRLSVSGEPKL